MGYERKPRKKIKWRIAIPLGILVVAFAYLLFNLIVPKASPREINEICTYDDSKSVNLLTKEYTKTYQISDYLFYGESLSFFKEKYNPEEVDELQSKTIRLINLCNNDEILFQMTNTFDRQIALQEIPEGFYEVYVVNNLENYRMTSSKEFSDTFHTITRDDATKKIEVIATNNYANSEKDTQQTYVFLSVSNDKKQKDSIDVLIDPYGGMNDYGYGYDYGYEANGLVENKEMFEAAKILKEKLEAYGLQVGITKKDKDQKININGVDGRIAQGYEKNAKLYISLQINKHELSEVNGIEITHSNYMSSMLANSIVNGLSKVGLDGNILIPGTLADGVHTPILVEGEDGRKIYDGNNYIRETGGYATLAGCINENMKELNGEFAFENRKGMQAIVVHLLYISNPMNYKLWVDDKESILSNIADSVALYLNIEKKEQE